MTQFAAGIDYGLGMTNIDKTNGIRYGVISSHSVGTAWYESAEAEYGEPHCPECGNEIPHSDDAAIPEDAEWNDGKDYACVQCETCYWSDSVFPDEALGYSYSGDGYELSDCLDNDIFILKSDYYTFALYCSPCVPGAGNLDSAHEDGVKTYALGHDWFEDGKAPYPVYRVLDDSLVVAE
jgi:hypothetical protein